MISFPLKRLKKKDKGHGGGVCVIQNYSHRQIIPHRVQSNISKEMQAWGRPDVDFTDKCVKDQFMEVAVDPALRRPQFEVRLQP